MSSYSWKLPAPVAGAVSSGGVAALFGALGKTPLGGFLDLVLDPITRDYIDTDDGAWLESADSRTIVMIMLETEFGSSPFDWQDGTRIKAELRNDSGDPITLQFIAQETTRALGVLVGFGVISDLEVKYQDVAGNDLEDDNGLPTIALWWRDLASGSTVDLYYTPEG